jgi:hypothetical protein
LRKSQKIVIITSAPDEDNWRIYITENWLIFKNLYLKRIRTLDRFFAIFLFPSCSALTLCQDKLQIGLNQYNNTMYINLLHRLSIGNQLCK